MRVAVDNATTVASETCLAFETLTEPTVTINYGEAKRYGNGGKGVMVLDVDSGDNLSRFWVNVEIKDGKPVVTVATKPDKERKTEKKAKVRGDFNIPRQKVS